MIIEGHAIVAATPEQVFAVLVNPETWFQIDPTLVEVTPRTPIVLGATGTMRNRRAGIVATVTWTTTGLVPGELLVQHTRGFGYELTESVTLAPAGAGTEMTVVDTVAPTSIAGRLMVATSRGILERDLRSRFTRLQALLEAPVS